MEPALHPDVAPIAFLLGAWRGEGRGEYPTIEPFGYIEEIEFRHVGKPFLAYSQRTRATDDGRPLHSESGYWRCTAEGALEVILAHPTGVTEIAQGRVVGTKIELGSTTLGLSSTAKQVDKLERFFEVDGDTLTYRLSMAAVGVPLTHHLSATLRRT